MEKSSIKKVSGALVALFLAALLLFTVPAQAAYLSVTHTVVGEKVEISVTVENAKDEILQEGFGDSLIVSVTLPNGTVVELTGADAKSVTLTGPGPDFGYGYLIPDLIWEVGYGYGYGYSGGVEKNVKAVFSL